METECTEFGCRLAEAKQRIDELELALRSVFEIIRDNGTRELTVRDQCDVLDVIAAALDLEIR